MSDRIETSSGLSLRPWSAEDVAAVVTAFAEPIMQWQTESPVDSTDAAERWLAKRAELRESGYEFAFAVVDGDGTVLGNMAVDAVNLRHGFGWVSYWTTASARGRGVATTGCRALADWAFGDLGLHRLELGHRVNNPTSCRVARAAGFVVEGLQRQRLDFGGVRHDVELHARLATDPA
jgi:RimJ/RimL family protein N-acetyltransferase